MNRIRALCGRDVIISINGKRLLQAESAELRNISELHRIRSCFCSDDIAHTAGRREYKLNLVGIRFRQPFENCNFYDLDNFTVTIELDGLRITLEGCMWDDFKAVAKSESFREHISITALRMRTEDEFGGA